MRRAACVLVAGAVAFGPFASGQAAHSQSSRAPSISRLLRNGWDNSQASPGSDPTPNAHVLAQRVDRHYNSLRSLKANFTESYEGLGITRADSGTLLLLKPGRMKWEYSSPPGKLFLLDGKYAWSYTPGDSHVQRIPAKDLNDLRSPLRYLLGHAQLAKELRGLAAAPAPGGQFTLTGVPKDMENRVARLALTVTSGGTIAGIEITETDGAVTRFTFSNEQPDAPVPPRAFHFTPPPGVPVVDSLPPV
ncbi:MAG: LolA family protein [Terracidiphilus sp.]